MCSRRFKWKFFQAEVPAAFTALIKGLHSQSHIKSRPKATDVRAQGECKFIQKGINIWFEKITNRKAMGVCKRGSEY